MVSVKQQEMQLAVSYQRIRNSPNSSESTSFFTQVWKSTSLHWRGNDQTRELDISMGARAHRIAVRRTRQAISIRTRHVAAALTRHLGIRQEHILVKNESVGKSKLSSNFDRDEALVSSDHFHLDTQLVTLGNSTRSIMPRRVKNRKKPQQFPCHFTLLDTHAKCFVPTFGFFIQGLLCFAERFLVNSLERLWKV